ncbi:MAG: HlyD family secretion protein [Lachnospiraceae bacterium]|nr:HlyD family secretion protein [Lachnospiraceae bacterium]
MDYIDKNIEIREKKLRYDFLPPMLEIIERPANKAGTVIIWLVVLTVITAVIWACLFRLDIAVTATGIVMPKDNLVTLQSGYGGLIEKIYASDGDELKKGDPVLDIRQTDTMIEIDDLKYDLEVLKIQREVYERLMKGEAEKTDVSVYGEYASIAQALLVEDELYRSRHKEYELNGGDGKDELVTTQMESYDLEHELTMLQNINSLDIKIHDKESEIENAEYKMESKTVYAPVDGILSQMQYTTEGTVIESTKTVAYMIKDGSEMIFKAYVKDEDIEGINEGDEVNVKLSSLDDTDHELIKGTVSKVSDITVSVEGSGNVYPVEIKLIDAPVLNNRNGAEGTCDIITGTRSVMDYFIEPFRKGLRDSLKER